MNGVKEEFTIKMKQTSKGIWYCDGLQITSEHISELVGDLDQVMIQVEGILQKHNYVEEPNKWEKAAKKAKEPWAKAEPKLVDSDGEK